MIRTALKKRINILAITDHNTLKGYPFFIKFAKECSERGKGDIFILPAEEIGCPEGDVLAYGISEEIEKGRVAETLDKIHDQGALAVMAHPFSFFTSVSANVAKKNHFDGIEVINYNSADIFNKLSQKFAKARPNLFRLGGNDAHQPWDVGITLNLIDAEPELESILKALKKNKIKIVQSPASFPWRAHYYLKNSFSNPLTIVRTGIKYQVRWMLKKNLLKRKNKHGA